MSDASPQISPDSTHAFAAGAAEGHTDTNAGRVRRAVLTWMSGGLFTIVTMLVGLIATPLLLHWLGDARVGAVRVVNDMIGYVSLLDFGLAGALSVLILRSQARGDGAGVASAVRRGIRLLVPLAAAMLCIALPLAYWMPRLVAAPDELRTETQWAAFFIALTLVFTPLMTYRSVLESAQRGYIINALLLGQSLLITAISLMLAFLGFGMLSQTAAMFAGAVAFSVSISAFGRRSLSASSQQLSQTQSTPDIANSELWSLSWPLLVATLTNRVNLMTDSIVINQVLGTSSAVTMLIVTQQLLRLVGGQVNGLASASWAALAEIHAEKGPAAFEARLVELVRLVVGLGLALTGTMAAFNRHFVALWVGNERFGGDLLSFFTFLSLTIFGFFVIFSFILDTQGFAKQRLPATIVGSTLNLGLSIVLTKQFGIAGVAMGTCVAYLLTDAWFGPYLVCKHFEVRGKSIAAAAARGLVVGVPFVAIAWTVAYVIRVPSNRWTMAAELAAAALAAISYCWLFVLTAPERARWSARIVGRLFANRFLNRVGFGS